MAFPVVRGMRGLELGNPGEPVEEPGELLALVDDDVEYLATVRVTRVDVTTLAEVPDSFALAEGEGDLDADDFRASHIAYWTREAIAVDESTILVLVYFELVDQA